MYDVYLAHHGVKGQKWGIRRYQNEDGSYKAGHEGRYDPYYEKKSKKYKTLSDKDDIVEKGTKLYRVTSGSDGHKETEKGRTYVTSSKKEADEYAELLGALNYDKNTYMLEYTAAERLVSPSEKKRVDVFLDMYRDKKYGEAMLKNIKKNTKGAGKAGLFVDNFRSSKSIKKDFERMQKGYVTSKDQRRLSNFLMTEPDIRDEYFRRLRKMGYNSVADDNDRNNGVSKTALVVIERSESLKLGRQYMTEEGVKIGK